MRLGHAEIVKCAPARVFFAPAGCRNACPEDVAAPVAGFILRRNRNAERGPGSVADATTTALPLRPRVGEALLANRIRPGHLNGEAETGQVFARTIVRIGELWNAKIQRPRFLAFIDRGIEVDEVPALPALAVRQGFE